MTEKLEYLSAAELGREIVSGTVTPTEAVEYFHKRIEARNPDINAMVYTRLDHALSEAKKLEERLSKGERIGPFAGVPFGMKDFLPSKKGWPSSHGGVKSLIRDDLYDSEFTRAMERAGGIALGKTNAPAFGFRGTCDNKLYGPTRNPFDTRYNSGGSSGGSAAAVADGLLPIAEGGDGGGSIRIPAAWCNLYGFKASVGSIPNICRPDAWAATHPYCTPGGLTKTVEDAAILYSYMARHDAADPLSVPGPKRAFSLRGVKGMKIAYTPDFGVFPVEPEVAEMAENAAVSFREAGAQVERVDIKLHRGSNELSEAWCRAISVDTAIELELMRRGGFDLAGGHRGELPEEFIYWNKKAASGGIMDYYEFNLIRTELYDAQRKIFDKYDLLISPTTVCLPVQNANDGNTLGPEEVNGVPVERLLGFAETFMANFTGNPAASCPAGFSKSGLPVGIQLMGRRFDDLGVLGASAVFEELRPWRRGYEKAFSRTI